MKVGQPDVTVVTGMSAILDDEWDICACPEASSGRAQDPFSTYRFLIALEESGSAIDKTGWQPMHLVARMDGQVIAVMPLYAKSHSHGEFVFDHGWADAFERAGGAYYPKLQSSIPFTPVQGRRLLTRRGFELVGAQALTDSAKILVSNYNLSSLHMTFCAHEEVQSAPCSDFLHRTGEQYHWFNNGYGSFDDFLSELSSRKRRNIKKERRRASESDGQILLLTGDDIKRHHWDSFWCFYQDTGQRKWGIPYLTREFFDIIHDMMRDDILLILYAREGKPVAGALNFIGRDALFGRYWGCLEHHPCLHFELCYYQAIEFAIRNQLARVEAGAQGQHKIARGYRATATHSLHWIANPAFRRAVDHFLRDETLLVQQNITALEDASPFKHEGRKR